MTPWPRARARPHGDTDAEAHEFVAEEVDYDVAYAAARAAVPGGWDLLSVQAQLREPRG